MFAMSCSYNHPVTRLSVYAFLLSMFHVQLVRSSYGIALRAQSGFYLQSRKLASVFFKIAPNCIQRTEVRLSGTGL